MTDVVRNVRPPGVIEQIEDALLEHLKESVSGQCKVEAFPNDPAQYDFSGLPAALLIHYSASRYTDPAGPANAVQARGMQFSLVLLCRSLRGQGGAYRHLEDIRLAVQGKPFAGSGPARIVRDALEEEKGGIWRWQIAIALPLQAVPRQHPVTPLQTLMRPAIPVQP